MSSSFVEDDAKETRSLETEVVLACVALPSCARFFCVTLANLVLPGTVCVHVCFSTVRHVPSSLRHEMQQYSFQPFYDIA